MKKKNHLRVENIRKRILVLLLTITLVAGSGISSFADQSTVDSETKAGEAISQQEGSSAISDEQKEEITTETDSKVETTSTEEKATVDNQVEAMSQSIKTISPKLAGKSAGGIDISAAVPTTFRTYTDPTSGLAPSQLNVALAVSISQANIEGAYIELPYDGFMPSLGDPVYEHFDMNEDIFSLVMPEAPATGSIVDSYVNDTTNHKLIIKLKKTTTTIETLNIKFNYNPDYDAKIPSAQTIWKDVKATVKASDNSEIAVTNTYTVKAETFGSDLTVSYERFSPIDENISSDIATIRFHYWNLARNKDLIDTTYDNYYYIDIPTGYDFSPKGFFGDISKVETENITGYTRYKVKFQDSSTYFPYYWAENIGGFYQLDATLEGFENLPVGESIDFKIGIVGKKINGAVKTNEQTIKYTKEAIKNWDIYTSISHGTGSTPLSVVNASVPNSQSKMYGQVGVSSYGHSWTTKNIGLEDIKDYKVTLYQKNTDSAKAAFSTIAVHGVTESISVPVTQYKVQFDIKNANTSDTRKTETGLYSGTKDISLPTLSAGEYIDKVIVVPMGVNGTDEGHLPSKNGLAIQYKTKNWDTLNWPDGTPIDQTKTTQVKMAFTTDYLDEKDSGNPTAKQVQGDTMIHYYAPGNAVGAYANMVSSNSTSRTPGDTINYEIQGYNGLQSVANEWKSPEVTIAVPKMLQLQTSTFKTDFVDVKNGVTYPNAVNIEKLPSSDTDTLYNYYRLTTDKSTYKNISSYTDLLSSKIPLEFKVASGTPVGTYTIPTVTVSGDNFIQVTRAENNLSDPSKFGYDNGTDRYSATTSGHTPTTVASSSKLNGSTSSRANSSSTWTDASYFGVEKNTVPQMKSDITNIGNTTFTNARLYNILPYDGDTRGSSGNAEFAGVTGTGTVYYTTKPVGQLPSYSGLDLQTWTASTLTSYGFSTTAPSDLSTVTAIYVDYGTADVVPNDSLSSILNFKIPNADNQKIVNQFAYSAKEKTSSAKITTTSELVTFSTEIGQVTYHDNTPVATSGTVADMPDPISQTVVLDAQKKASLTLSPSVPKLLGYNFTNWKDADNNVTYNPGAIVNFDAAVNSDTILDFNAQWTPNTYKVKFDNNTGTGTMTDQNFTYDTAQNLTANTFTKTGCTFDGWTTNSDGTGTSYTDGESVKNLTTDNGGEVTLYAKWTANTYKVKFDANTGTGTMTDQDFVYGTAQNLTTNTFTKTGYTFAGWTANADGTGTSYTDSENVNNLTTTNNGTVTLYAKWTPNTYKVKFDSNTGTGTMADQNFTYDEAKALSANEFTKTGHTFDGWTTVLDGATTYSNNLSVKNLTSDNGATITLYAKWVANEYDITYELDGGTNNIANPMKYTYGTSTTLEDPEKEGYIFVGWYDTPSDGNKITEISTTDIGEKTLYARWEAADVSYKVEHYKMNVDGTYPDTPSDTDSLIGKTDSNLVPITKDYTGYTYDNSITTYVDNSHSQQHAELPIAADGTLVIKCYYQGHEDVTGDITTPIKEAFRGDVIDYTIKIGNSGTINSDDYEVINIPGNGLENVSTDTKTLSSVKNVASTTKATSNFTWDVTVDSNGDKIIKTKAKVTSDAGKTVDNIVTFKNKKTGETFKSNVIVAVKENPKTKVTVSFESNGGDYTPEDQTFDAGGKVTRPEPPKKNGAEFEGWYSKGYDGKLTAWNFNTKVYQDTTLYAKWNANGGDAGKITHTKTGDNSNISLMLILGLVGAIGTISLRKRKTEKK